ncbi:MAG: ZIP family metal transporter [Nanoarchaeota archaeon]
MVLSYILISVIIVSCISFVGILTLTLRQQLLQKLILYLVSFAAGALLGDAFLHLLPEALEQGPISRIALYILTGIVVFFAIEKFIAWRHTHHAHVKEIKQHGHRSFVYMNLIGDATHNFMDGLIIAGSYLVSIPLGISTTLAVVLHEIPQEIGDFAVLIHGGLKISKALWLNFLSAVTAIMGAIVAWVLQNYVENIAFNLSAFAIGAFIYIANSDLIPELHKEKQLLRQSIKQLIALILGMLVMAALLLLE